MIRVSSRAYFKKMTEKLTIEQYRAATGQQPNPSAKQVSHSNRGREFETLIERTNHYYSVRKIAFIEKNPTVWRYVNKSQFDTFRDSTSDFVAKTNRGLYLKRFKSDVDFSGVLAPNGRAISFDSKEIKGKSLPLGNIAEHQIQTLRQAEEVGGIAGLMIMFSDLQRVFFVSASVVEQAVIQMLYHRGAKSLSLSLCESEGKEIQVVGGLVEYLEVIS